MSLVPTSDYIPDVSILSLLWRYKIVIGIIFTVILVIVLIIVLKPKNTDTQCPKGQIKNPCKDGCVTPCPSNKIQKCDNGVYTCICTDLSKTCGDNCCLSNEQCDPTNTCKPTCGKHLCDSNQICEVIHNVSDKTNNDVYVCVDKPSTYFSNKKQLPVPIDDTEPCYQIGNGFCTSKNVGDKIMKKKCFGYDQSICQNNTNCTWWDTLSHSDDLENLKKEYTIASSKSPYGYYCKPDANTYRRINTSNGTNSTYEDCLRYMYDPSVSNVYWDDDKKMCMSLQECNLPKCPLVIKNPSYNFKEDGQIYQK